MADEQASRAVQSPAGAPEPQEEKGPARRRVLIVGAGQTGRALARILSDSWEIVVLDPDEQKIEAVRAENPNKEIRLLNKDGTSLLNLKEAGLEGAEWLAAVTDFDEANYEACRLARSVTEPPTAIGVVRRPEAEEKLKEAGAEVLVRPAAVAGLIKNRIERAHQVATGVGLGEGEILEIPVLRTSPAVDVRVQDLRARRWLVAAIYRDDSYVVPHGHVVIREGDRLLLTGQPDILPHIADYLRAGVARFPLQYGVRAVAVGTARPTEAFWEEVRYIFNNTRSRALRGLATKSSPPPNLQLDRSKLEVGVINETDDIATIIRRDVPGLDCGLLIVPKHRVDFLGRAGLRRPWFGDPLDAIACPMLLAAGSHPYRRILLPIIGQEAHLATEVAIDVSRQLHVEIAAVIATRRRSSWVQKRWPSRTKRSRRSWRSARSTTSRSSRSAARAIPQRRLPRSPATGTSSSSRTGWASAPRSSTRHCAADHRSLFELRSGHVVPRAGPWSWLRLSP